MPASGGGCSCSPAPGSSSIAHDRAGFGGGLATTGLIVLAVVSAGAPARALWQALALAGASGFGAAIGVHGLIGYLDGTHVGPAILAAWLFAIGMWLVRPWMLGGRRSGPGTTTVATGAPDAADARDQPPR